ncbi:hypothetical protein ZHAS_00021788 [Anopheles sinensis]|uniref:Uncharacterized protein n=1 Tax=Anopheles sinensis TaxID=74873 RepID=A0A084WTL1_ANOSI|nr:hypothetical protein ZHAS_00021788 [Anopheles sinensis]
MDRRWIGGSHASRVDDAPIDTRSIERTRALRNANQEPHCHCAKFHLNGGAGGERIPALYSSINPRRSGFGEDLCQLANAICSPGATNVRTFRAFNLGPAGEARARVYLTDRLSSNCIRENERCWWRMGVVLSHASSLRRPRRYGEWWSAKNWPTLPAAFLR